MFTGIVTNQAVVTEMKARAGQVRFCFRFIKKEKRAPKLGESVAVNGVCLTVAARKANAFYADAIAETLKATNLGSLSTGSRVHTERALRHGDSMGGHFVSGHVDGQGILRKIEKAGKNRVYWFEAPEELRPYLAPKGSICVDGVSLTVQEVRGGLFKLGIVPHTLKETRFAAYRVGDKVNLEADLVARYLQALHRGNGKKAKSGGRLRAVDLKKQGF